MNVYNIMSLIPSLTVYTIAMKLCMATKVSVLVKLTYRKFLFPKP